MKSLLHITLAIILSLSWESGWTQNKLKFDGQLSSWVNYNPDNEMKLFLGGRYLPELNYGFGKPDTQYFDFEVSANIYGNAFIRPFDSTTTAGDILPYRAFARYSTAQFELRAGLQKISFGSASVLRPLMWFDQIDPRDPLRITNGVWGLLGRYYFINNANIWGWVLYGNETQKGWEQIQSNKRIPEFGGRIQYPVSHGEIGLTYHHRNADSRHLGIDSLSFSNIPENRIGIDGKWDLKVGLWFEGSYIRKKADLGFLTNQVLLNGGIDYTFGLGNGLNVILEQLVFAYDKKAFAFENPRTLTASTFSYPLGLFDNISSVIYYDWAGENLFTFLNYQRQMRLFTINVIAYWNPGNTQLIQQVEGANPFGGKGIQIMLVYNH